MPIIVIMESVQDGTSMIINGAGLITGDIQCSNGDQSNRQCPFD